MNETVFLVSPDALQRLRIATQPIRATRLAVFSDGLQMVALTTPDAEAFPGFFRPLFEFVANNEDEGESRRKLEEFLGSSRVRQRTDDDLTLLLAAYRVP